MGPIHTRKAMVWVPGAAFTAEPTAVGTGNAAGPVVETLGGLPESLKRPNARLIDRWRRPGSRRRHRLARPTPTSFHLRAQRVRRGDTTPIRCSRGDPWPS